MGAGGLCQAIDKKNVFFLVVIRSNVFTWLLVSMQSCFHGIIHKESFLVSLPECLWKWNPYKLDQQVGYFPLLLQLKVPVAPPRQENKFALCLHTRINSHAVYGAAARLFELGIKWERSIPACNKNSLIQVVMDANEASCSFSSSTTMFSELNWSRRSPFLPSLPFACLSIAPLSGAADLPGRSQAAECHSCQLWGTTAKIGCIVIQNIICQLEWGVLAFVFEILYILDVSHVLTQIQLRLRVGAFARNSLELVIRCRIQEMNL